ncbi:hypothetical protein KJ885_04895 [Patescibacteria group bacterium]|nr:hypothetical protein [Patescibacteria group bacterium]
MNQNPMIQKNNAQLLIALKENLQILKEELVDIPNTLGFKPYRVRVVLALLRVLVCDTANHSKDGLLRSLAKECNFIGSIIVDGKEISLEEYLKLPVSGDLTIKDMILLEAQKRSIVHEDRKEQHYMSCILDMGTTERSNLRTLYYKYATNILKFGEQFLQYLEEEKSKHRDELEKMIKEAEIIIKASSEPKEKKEELIKLLGKLKNA